MAPEPEHLVDIVKTCPRCHSHRNKFSYFDNKKPNQPRYKCGDCRKFYTLGGRTYRCRKSKPAAGDRRKRFGKSSKPSATKLVKPPTRSRIGVARDRRTHIVKSPAKLRAPVLPVRGVADRRSGGTRILKPEPVPKFLPAIKSGVGVVPMPMPPPACVELAKEPVNWVKAVLGIAPYGLVPVRQKRGPVRQKPVPVRKELNQLKLKFPGRREFVTMVFVARETPR